MATKLQGRDAARLVVRMIRDARFPEGLVCVRCGAKQLQRWGSFAGRQRYRCEACRRTFSDLTGTPAAYLKKLDRLPAYLDQMRYGRSVRASARRIGVHKDTAFRWRHRLLTRSVADDETRLRGFVEYYETYFPESFKGRTPPNRAARRRGIGRYVVLHARKVFVVVGLSRYGALWTGVTGIGRPTSHTLQHYLLPRLRKATLLTTTRRMAPVATVARRTMLIGGLRVDGVRAGLPIFPSDVSSQNVGTT